ncbi:hypothetical protein ND747_19780, partial [Frankia sp. R82]|nr:hypothetical protein [Frankia sp. R82]
AGDGAAALALPARTATAINIPAAAYPRGYQVRITGGRVTSAVGSGLLCVVADPGAARVEIRVRPATDGPQVQSPLMAGPAGCDTTTAAAAGAAATSGAPGASGAGRSVAAAQAGRDDTDTYSGPLLWILPLVGATAALGLLAAVLRPWRRRPGPSTPTWTGGD